MTRTPSLNRAPRSPHKLARASLVAFAKSAANDEAAPCVRPGELASGQGHMIDEIIREMVRSEVRAEVARGVPATSVQPTYLSVAEYAKARSISISTVRSAIRSGRLPAIKIGTAIRVRADVEIGEPVVVRPSRRPVSPAARGAEIFEARRKRSPGRSDGKQTA
jgi:excisionase family DNA binding protein